MTCKRGDFTEKSFLHNILILTFFIQHANTLDSRWLGLVQSSIVANATTSKGLNTGFLRFNRRRCIRMASLDMLITIATLSECF